MDSNLKSLFVLVSNMSTSSHTLGPYTCQIIRSCIQIISFKATDMLKNNFVYRVIKVWNPLSQTVCEAGTLSMFKIKSDYLHNDYIFEQTNTVTAIHVLVRALSKSKPNNEINSAAKLLTE